MVSVGKEFAQCSSGHFFFIVSHAVAGRCRWALQSLEGSSETGRSISKITYSLTWLGICKGTPVLLHMGLSVGLWKCSHAMAAGSPQSKGSKRSSQKLQCVLLPKVKPGSLFPPHSISHTKAVLSKYGRGLHKGLNIRRCRPLENPLRVCVAQIKRQINIKCEPLYPLTYSDISLDYWHPSVSCLPPSYLTLLPLGLLYWLIFPSLLKSNLTSDLTTNINVHPELRIIVLNQCLSNTNHSSILLNCRI